MTSDCFYFYSKSANKKPGYGCNEIATKEYLELSKILDWRKVLSNFHFSPFMFEGKTYNTIEHVFQSKKIALVDPYKANFFTVESGHAIGKGDGAIAQKNRKLVVLKSSDLAIWFQTSDKIMENAAIAKYSQCSMAMNILKNTGNAELWHVVSRKKPVRFNHLERIRNKCKIF